MDDEQYLREFVKSGSHEAFAKLVDGYIDIVFSAALRQVKDVHIAEDVTQGTFVALSRKAHTIGNTALAAWLLTTTRFLALDALKAKRRRKRHEQEAASMGTKDQPATVRDSDAWEAILPHLDAALASLGKKDREALILRYFEDKRYEEIAKKLAVTVEAARQRVHRATVRTREFFTRCGVRLSMELIDPAIVAHATHRAPPALAKAATAKACPAMGLRRWEMDASMPRELPFPGD